MKVTSDRIKARALQLRKEGFKLSGSVVRRTLELNAGARVQPPPRDKEATVSKEVQEQLAEGQKKIKAA